MVPMHERCCARFRQKTAVRLFIKVLRLTHFITIQRKILSTSLSRGNSVFTIVKEPIAVTR